MQDAVGSQPWSRPSATSFDSPIFDTGVPRCGTFSGDSVYQIRLLVPEDFPSLVLLRHCGWLCYIATACRVCVTATQLCCLDLCCALQLLLLQQQLLLKSPLLIAKQVSWSVELCSPVASAPTTYPALLSLTVWHRCCVVTAQCQIM